MALHPPPPRSPLRRLTRGARSRAELVGRAKRLLGRLRWRTKWRTVRAAGRSPVRHLGHVLRSPELESFSYRLADPAALAAQVAEVLGTSVEEQLVHLAELELEPEVHERLRERTRWRWTVRTAPPPGNRVAWYLLVRTLRPSLVVETGIYDGLGSLVLLCALERNAAEGAPGELVSVDPVPWAGSLVPERLRGRWTPVRGVSTTDLEPAIGDREVGVLFSDSPHTRENQEAEFATAMDHAAGRLVLVECSGGWCPVLAELAEREGVALHTVRFPPAGHFYDAGANGIVVLDRPAA